MKRVYIVEKGEYSDKHICAVFSSLEKAQKFVEQVNQHNDEDYLNIVDFLIDVSMSPLDQGKFYYYVYLPQDSNMSSSVYKETLSFYDEDGVLPNDIRVKPKEFRESQNLISGRVLATYTTIGYSTYVWAKTEEEAIKIASERIRVYKAVTPPTPKILEIKPPKNMKDRRI